MSFCEVSPGVLAELGHEPPSGNPEREDRDSATLSNLRPPHCRLLCPHQIVVVNSKTFLRGSCAVGFCIINSYKVSSTTFRNQRFDYLHQLKMPLPRYTYQGPIDHTAAYDRANVKAKSVIITGGANGMGEACVRDFVAAGAYVTFADVNEERGKAVEKELNSGGDCCVFVRCDIRDWDQQVNVFETAKSKSPHKSVDIVIANAGISRSSGDSLWNLDGRTMFDAIGSLADMCARPPRRAYQARSEYRPC